jgi:dTDP-4-dehydrorhamnose reductase
METVKEPRLLLTGASGQLGGYLLREGRQRDMAITAWSGSRTGPLFGVPLVPVDLADPDRIALAFQEARPTVVIHAGAITTVADSFRNPQRAHQINTDATAVLAELATRARARLLFLSTDLVFDGEQGWYRESDVPSPLSVYGRTKAAAEQPVLACRGGVVARLSLLFGPALVDRPSFFDDQIKALRAHRSLTLFEDEWRTPLDLATAARGLLALAESDFVGLLHLGGPERLSRLEMGRRLADFLRCDPAAIVAATRNSVRSPEPRPRDVSLDTARWRELFPRLDRPTWSEAMRRLTIP